jgi:hypothetical protein
LVNCSVSQRYFKTGIAQSSASTRNCLACISVPFTSVCINSPRRTGVHSLIETLIVYQLIAFILLRGLLQTWNRPYLCLRIVIDVRSVAKIFFNLQTAFVKLPQPLAAPASRSIPHSLARILYSCLC